MILRWINCGCGVITAHSLIHAGIINNTGKDLLHNFGGNSVLGIWMCIIGAYANYEEIHFNDMQIPWEIFFFDFKY